MSGFYDSTSIFGQMMTGLNGWMGRQILPPPHTLLECCWVRASVTGQSTGEDKYWLSACSCSLPELAQWLPCNPDIRMYRRQKKTPDYIIVACLADAAI